MSATNEELCAAYRMHPKAIREYQDVILDQQNEIAAMRAERDALKSERDALKAFKSWVHKYLDDHGVPHHPPGTHGAEGCRIGDRMDWLMARVVKADPEGATL